jgi:hypothetical protein
MTTPPFYDPQQVPLQRIPVPKQTLPNSRSYIALLLAGVLLLLIGGVVSMSVGLVNDPDDSNGWDSDDPWEDYTDFIRTINTLGQVIQYIGILILSGGLIVGAIRDESLHANVRMGMFIAMGLIIGFKIMIPNPW